MKFAFTAFLFASLVCGVFGVAPGGGDGGLFGRRLNLDGCRRLDDEFEALVAKCGDQDYTVDLIVLEHLYFLFEPTPQAQAAGCDDMLLADTTSTLASGGMTKQFVVAPLFDNTSPLFSAQHGTIDFGMYPLNDIIKAYQDASPFAEGKEDQDYDYIANNCGDLLANVLKNLGHTSSPLETKIIADLAVYVAPDFVAMVREMVKGTDKENWSDEKLMVWLVEMRLQPMYESGMVSELANMDETTKEDGNKAVLSSILGAAVVGLLVLTNIVMTWRLGRNQKVSAGVAAPKEQDETVKSTVF